MKRQCIFRFLYSSAQAKEPDIRCLLLFEGQSRILREQSLLVSVYLSKWSQNDGEPRGRGGLESVRDRSSFSSLIDTTWIRVTELEVLSMHQDLTHFRSSSYSSVYTLKSSMPPTIKV